MSRLARGVVFSLLVGALFGVPLVAQSPLGDPLEIRSIRDFLPAEGFGAPAPDAPPELRQFGQLAGIWLAEQEIRRRDGTWVTAGPALWVWRYALDGFAVQDLWFQAADQLPEYLGPLGRNYLLSGLRFYSPSSQRWEIAWVANGLGQTPGNDFGTFEGRMIDGRLVMTSPAAANPQRIVFSDFAPDAFLWTSEFSQDGGQTWIAVMRVRAHRYR